jgi:hypothetical protein
VLVVPVEEQATVAGQREEGNARAEQPLPQGVTATEPVQQKVSKAAVATPSITAGTGLALSEKGDLVETGESPQEATSRPAKEDKRGQRAAVKYKKVISRKKAGKQTRTIIVSMPREEEEMVDIGPRAKKRGRPRKTPSWDPPDPRKGSVVDPGKGVCADPVNRDAILGKGGTGPGGGNKERQFSQDRGRDKT